MWRLQLAATTDAAWRASHARNAREGAVSEGTVGDRTPA